MPAGAPTVGRVGAPSVAPGAGAGGDDFDELQPATSATKSNQRTARLYAEPSVGRQRRPAARGYPRAPAPVQMSLYGLLMSLLPTYV